ncbi:MAG: hypothetical protein IPL26_00300 [Leptospiraceae bacterium]|nr:hypothetical protein [Leptospiraceae bacterium]
MIIRVTNEIIYLSSHESIPTEKTNLPMEHLHFRTRLGYEIFWKCKSKIELNTKVLILDVLDFSPVNAANIHYAQGLYLNGNSGYTIYFDKLDWSGLEKFLTCYRKDSLSTILKEEVKK